MPMFEREHLSTDTASCHSSAHSDKAECQQSAVLPADVHERFLQSGIPDQGTKIQSTVPNTGSTEYFTKSNGDFLNNHLDDKHKTERRPHKLNDHTLDTFRRDLKTFFISNYFKLVSTNSLPSTSDSVKCLCNVFTARCTIVHSAVLP